MNHRKSKTRANKNIFLKFFSLLFIKVCQINGFYAIRNFLTSFLQSLQRQLLLLLFYHSFLVPFSTRFHISLYAMSSKTKLTHKVYEKVSWREKIKPKNKWLECNRYIEKDKMVKLQNTSAFRIEYNKNEKKIDIHSKKNK